MKTYTEHKLTDAMLRQLSRASKGKTPTGMAARGLEARRLIVTRWWRSENGRDLYDGREITEVGRQALANARTEGW